MNKYVSWSPTASTHDDFYTDDSCRIWYKNQIHAVLNRVNTFNGLVYKNDSTIFAWELANEPRCESDISGNTLQAWIEEMSGYVKSLDSLHMVTTGSEGFYGSSGPPHNPFESFNDKGVDFIRNHQPSTIDFAVFHLWPDSWTLDYPQSIAWVTNHCQDSDVLLGKPVVLEEYGKARPDSIRNQYFSAWLNQIYLSASSNGAAGGSILWILYHDAYPDYDGFGVYFPADSTTVAILEAHADQMNQLSLSVAPGKSAEASFRGPIITLQPNPTNSLVSISFYLTVPQQVTLSIFDIAGRKVSTLAKGLLPAGTNIYPWHTGKTASGVYIIRLETSSGVSESRFAIVK
jgi:mannan endo-1,4-beta-mannosidase